MAEKSVPRAPPAFNHGGGGRGGYGGGGDRRRDNYRDGGSGPDRHQHGGNRSRPYWEIQHLAFYVMGIVILVYLFSSMVGFLNWRPKRRIISKLLVAKDILEIFATVRGF